MHIFHHILNHDYPFIFPHIKHLDEYEIIHLSERHFSGFGQLDRQFRDFHKKYVQLYHKIQKNNAYNK